MSANGTEPRRARFDAKFRIAPELHEAMRQYGHEHRMSFQQIMEEGVRLALEGTEPTAAARALAQIVDDELAAIQQAPASAPRRINQLRSDLKRYLGTGDDVQPQRGPVAAYVARICDEPADEAEAALAAYLQVLADRE